MPGKISKTEVVETPTTIKLGDQEYTQEQLQESVGLANTVRELETKWNTKIDGIYPEFTKKSQRLKEVEAELSEMKQTQEKAKEEAARQTPSEDLTPEQLTQRAKEEARKLGLVFNDDLQKIVKEQYAQERVAERLIDEVNSLVSEVKTDGKPAVAAQEFMEYMRDTGITKVDLAYKAMKESELDAWKEAQLGKIKKTGMVTEETSAAGAGKVPPEKRPKNQQELNQALKEHFQTEG